jgi:mono/diheme cytochrome c family protein
MMKRRWIALAIVTVGAIAAGGASSSRASSPTKAAKVPKGPSQQVDPAALTSGRSLFLNRCARCHALPVVSKQSAEKWPKIVAKMSKRSGLKTEQGEAVLAYILAQRASGAR